MYWSKRFFACSVMIALIVGCSRPTTSSASNTVEQITVVGDDTAPEVAAELRKHGFNLTEKPTSVRSAKVVVIAEDATNGPRDAHRKLARDLGQNTDASVVWVLTKMNLVNDPEFVVLLQKEVQELLQEHGASKVRLQFAVDTEETTVGTDTLKGYSNIAGFLSKRSTN